MDTSDTCLSLIPKDDDIAALSPISDPPTAAAPPVPVVQLIAGDEGATPRTVTREVAEMSATIKNMLRDLDDAPDDGSTHDPDAPIPLSNVSDRTLSRVIEYCTHCVNTPEEEKGKETGSEKKDRQPKKMGTTLKESDTRTEWEKDFCDIPTPDRIELILAANYLDIAPLFDLMVKTLALTLEGKTPEEIRAMYNIEDDLTEEEKEEIRRENGWKIET